MLKVICQRMRIRCPQLLLPEPLRRSLCLWSALRWLLQEESKTYVLTVFSLVQQIMDPHWQGRSQVLLTWRMPSTKVLQHLAPASSCTVSSGLESTCAASVGAFGSLCHTLTKSEHPRLWRKVGLRGAKAPGAFLHYDNRRRLYLLHAIEIIPLLH